MNRAERRSNLKAFKAKQQVKNAYKFLYENGRLIVNITKNDLLKDGDVFTSDRYPGQEFVARIKTI